MIYLDNSNDIQEVFIPRIELNSNASPEYATKTELENAIENEVIRADGKYATKTDLLPYATTGWVESQNYVNSDEMASAITDAMTSETARTEETYQKITEMSAYSTTNEVENMIDDAVSGKMDTSAMSAYSTTEQMNAAITAATDDMATKTWVNEQGFLKDEALSGYATEVYVDNAVSGKVDESAMSAYTPTSGFATINGSAITEGGNIEIQGGGAEYSAGTNIDITNNVISVTGITVPTKLSDLENDEGFITESDIPTSNTAFTNDAGYITTADTQDFVTSGDVKTQIEGYGYITEDALSGYSTTEEMNQAIDNAVSGKMDTSGMTAYATTAFTEQTYLKEHQSLAGLFASVDYVSSAKTIFFYDKDNTEVGTVDATDFIKDGMVDSVYISGDTLYIVFNSDAGKETIEIPLSDIFNPDNYYTKDEVDSTITAATAATTGWVESQGYLTGFTETDPVFMASPASGITSGDIETWNSVTGKADTSRVDEVEQVTSEALNNLDDRVDELSANTSSAFTKVESHINEVEEVTADALVDINGRFGAYSSSTESAFTEVNNHINEVEEVTSNALVNINNRFNGFTGSTTSAFTEVNEHIDEVEDVAANALNNLNDRFVAFTGSTTSEFSEVNTHINEVEEVSADAFVDLNGRVAGLSANTTSAFTETNTHIDEVEDVTANALTNLNTRVNTKVGSSDIIDIVKISQSDYDSLTAKSSTTLYIIV